MRKYLASLVFGACALMASPLAAVAAGNAVTTEASSTILMGQGHSRAPLPGFRDEAAMVLVGTALIGLAAAVRRRA